MSDEAVFDNIRGQIDSIAHAYRDHPVSENEPDDTDSDSSQ